MNFYFCTLRKLIGRKKSKAVFLVPKMSIKAVLCTTFNLVLNVDFVQGVIKRCRLSWLTNSALVYEPKCGRGGCGVSANEYSCAHGAQIKFGDLHCKC
jgi:hypothetical protein